MAVKSYKRKASTKLSKNFKVKEFSCKGKSCGCKETLIDDQLVEYLQKIRDHFGKSVTITSGHRCATHNRSVRGATSSRHIKGQAADIKVKDVAPREVAKYAESIGCLGIGLYETANDGYFTHIDTRTTKSFWYGQAQAKRTSFGGAPKKATVKANAAVKEWQAAAKADGYSEVGSADGIWGPKSDTIAKKALCYCRSDGNFRNRNLTKIVQKAIGVEVDGEFGSDTEKALEAWQKAKGIKADGVAGYNTWKVILGL